jgi:predicted HAD superfamily Cof-like phosphohydrolase
MARSYVQRQVAEFHAAMGQVDPETPCDPTPEVAMKRARICAEEFAELIVALVGSREANRLFAEMVDKATTTQSLGYRGIVPVVDGAIDSYVVTAGTLLELGVDDMPHIDEICFSNMSKVGAGRDEHGKFRKGPNYRPPDLLRILKQRGYGS